MLVKVWKLAVNYIEGVALQGQMAERFNLNLNLFRNWRLRRLFSPIYDILWMGLKQIVKKWLSYITI